LHEGSAERGAFVDEAQEPGEAIGSAEDVRVAMGEADVVFDCLAEFVDGEIGEGCDEGGDLGEAADVFVLDAAFEGSFSLGVAGEESAVVFLEVGVAVPAGGEHEIDEGLGPEGRIVVALTGNLIEELAGELEVDGVFSGFEVLVIVDVPLAPEPGLIVENFAAFVEGGVFGTPENTIGVVFFGSLKGREVGVVSIQSVAVVIPVNRHGEGIGQE